MLENINENNLILTDGAIIETSLPSYRYHEVQGQAE